jgi:hypothetical protein
MHITNSLPEGALDDPLSSIVDDFLFPVVGPGDGLLLGLQGVSRVNLLRTDLERGLYKLVVKFAVEARVAAA